jgi:RimJ/RimL family protein N-acetyltransferase
MFNDSETSRYLGDTIQPESDAFARLLRNAGSWALYGYGTFIVRATGDQRIVGSCGVFRSHRGFGVDQGLDDVPEAGWIIHRDWWGQGAASEVMQAALAWFDATHGHQRVACMIEAGNDASVAVARKLGFVRVGMHLAESGTQLDLFARQVVSPQSEIALMR